MALSDDLTSQPTADEPKFVPKTSFDGVKGTIDTGPVKEPPASHKELLEKFGYDPDEVEIVGNIGRSSWQSFNGEFLHSYRYNIATKSIRKDADLGELFAKAAEWPPAALPRRDGRSVLVWQVSDTQIGKIDGDGIEGTLKRVHESLSRVMDRIIAERPPSVLLVFAGDCLEGVTSQGGRNMWRTSLTITEQVRVWRRLLFHIVTQIAPLVPDLTVAVVNGNHDEAQRQPVSTRPDDGWATEGAIAVSDAIENQPAFGHVKILVPERDKGYMTIGVQDSVFVILHGHQFRKGKAADWWESQAFYRDNAAGADFMLHGHFHSTSMSQDGPRTILCSGTYDGGSNWYRDQTGAVSRQGGLVFTTVGPEFYGLERV